MSAEGHGITAITKRLNREEVTPIGNSALWQRGYVTKLLAMRATIGEYQPYSGTSRSERTPDGPPIANYFPSILSEDEWYAAQAGLKARKGKGGRPTKRFNLFTALLRDARDGGGMYVNDKQPGLSQPALMATRATDGGKGSKGVTFPHPVFEREVLRQLREIDPAEIVPGNGSADRVLSLTGQKADVEGRIARIESQLVEGEDIALDVLRTLKNKLQRIENDLAGAKREAASPLSSAWGEYKSLADILDAASDPIDTRTRLRAALRRITESIWCLFVAKGVWRIAAVQVFFTGGRHRSYVIVHKPAKGNKTGLCRPAIIETKSFADTIGPDDFDIRSRKDARQLEAALDAVDVSVLEARDGKPARKDKRKGRPERKR
jgi:hypothetical protein